MVEQKFKNKKAILMASGPSLTKQVVNTIRSFKDDFIIFGCNDVYRLVDYLNIHYACDTKWWKHWGEHFRENRPNLESWTQCSMSAHKYNLNHINGTGNVGLSINNNLIHFGANSGYQMLNLAFLMGCKKFYLVGYNMQLVDDKRHFFGNHPKELDRKSPYNRFVQNFNTIQKEIKPLIKLSTDQSALRKIFTYVAVEDIPND